MAEQALDQDRVDRSSSFPPATEHLRAARRAMALTERQLAERFGTEGHLCPDLELHNDELFTCIALDDLIHLAHVLETSPAALLFGSDVPEGAPSVSFSEVVERIQSQLSATGATPDAWSEAAGWDITPILADPPALGTFNVQGLRDICRPLGLDWVAVLCERNRRGRPTRR